MRKIFRPSPVAQWLEQLSCYGKVPVSNPDWVITFPWFYYLCQIHGITPVVTGMCKRWQHLVKCAGPMRILNLQFGKGKVQQRVVDLSFGLMPDNLKKVCWAN